MKRRLKITLIEDYIDILRIESFCEYLKPRVHQSICGLLNSLIEVKDRLKAVYKRLFFKIGLMDLSLAILNKDILSANKLMFAEKCIDYAFVIENIRKNLQNVKNLEENLDKKLKKLSFNEFEKSYLFAV